MVEWITTIIAILGVIVSIVVYFNKLARFEERYYERHKNIEEKVDGITHMLGNGNAGLKKEVYDMQKFCAGHIEKTQGILNEVNLILKNQQHEIDEIKESK
jgi:hypothetical protein